MQLDRPFYPQSGPTGQNYSPYDGVDHEVESHLRQLQVHQQRLLVNLQRNPYHQHEIQNELRAIEREVLHYQKILQQQQRRQHATTPVTPTTDPSPTFNGFGKPNHQFHSSGDFVVHSGGANTSSVIGEGEMESMSKENPPPNAVLTSTAPGPMTGQFPSYENLPDPSSANEQIIMSSNGRVQGTMFPESMHEGEEVASTQIAPDQQTNLQRLAQPSQLLAAAVRNLVNYQSNTELTAHALPDIRQLLTNQDHAIVIEAAKLLHELSKKDPSLQAIVANSSIVDLIIQTLTNVNNAEIQKALAGAVHNISSDRQGLLTIYNCGSIPNLVRLLACQVDAVLFYAITTLHNMLLHYEPAKMDVRLTGGLEKMVALLVKDNVKFLAITADCLHILAYGHQDSKLIILASGGPSLLVRIMRIYSYEKLLWTVGRLLKALSVCPSNKPEIVQAGGMQVLSMHLTHRSGRLVQNILFTLRNLSDAATKQDNLDDLLRQLVVLLGSSDVNIVTCSAGVLSNLTCNNAKNKTILCQLHGVEALLRTINSAGGREEIIERCVCSLRHITSRHPGAEVAQNAVRDYGGIPMLMNLLQPRTRWPLIKALIGLFRNLALCHSNHVVLREQGCIPKLWQLLNRAHQESQRRVQPGVPPGYVDGVSMDEVVDCSTAALHLMARDPYNRLIMRQLNVIPTFIQLLYSQHEGIQRGSVGALSELALDPEGTEQIEREKASEPLTELLHSTNEGIAAYAAAVLFCLSEEKHLDRFPSGEIPGATVYRNEGMDSHMMGGGHPYFTGGNPMLGGRPVHYSNPGSIPGSQPFTPTMSEPPSGLMTPHSEFELPLDMEEIAPGFGFQSGPHSAHHSGIHTPNHPHSGIHTPHSAHHSGVHTPNHPVHTPNHFPSASLHQVPGPQVPSMHVFPPGPSPGMTGQGYHHIAQGSYNPPSPAIMDTATWGGLDSDL